MKVLRPTTITQACAMLADTGGAAVPIAGGTDLMVHWPEQLERHHRTYLDVTCIDGIRAHAWTDDALILGGGTTYWDLLTDPRAREELPLLTDAAWTVGAVQIQTRGTWAGNIANASPAADGVPAMMALDAIVILTSVRGDREVPLDAFYQGYKEMHRDPDELITAIRIPRRGGYQRFEKVGSRSAQAITKVGLALVRTERHGWRIVANSMAPTVRRCRNLEALLETGAPIGRPEDLLPAIRKDVAPIDDIRSNAAYREHVMARILFHALPDGPPRP